MNDLPAPRDESAVATRNAAAGARFDERFRTIADRCHDGVVIVDAEGRLRYLNRAAGQLLATIGGGPLGIAYAALLDPGDRSALVAALRSGEDCVATLRTAGGGACGRTLRHAFHPRALHGSSSPADARLTLITVQDLTELHQADVVLRRIVEGTSSKIGKEFFAVLVRELAEILQVHYAMVGRTVGAPPNDIDVLAFWDGAGYRPPFRYSLRGTPCERVVQREPCYIGARVRERFPHDHELAELAAESYFGMPLFNEDNVLLGILSIIDDGPMADTPLTRSVLSLFASRAGTELQRLEAEAALRREKDRLQIILRSIGDAVVATDRSGRVDFMNRAAETLTGWRSEEAEGRPVAEVVRLAQEYSLEPIPDPVGECLRSRLGTAAPDNAVLVARDGSIAGVEQTAAPILDDDGGLHGAVAILHDVSDSRRLTRELAYHANHDALTGLINRRVFETRLKTCLAASRQFGRIHVLAYLDLDQFKVVNDACGHIAGDALLQSVAGIIRRHVRERDSVSRLGGDEFGLIFVDRGIEESLALIQGMLDEMAAFRFVWRDQTFKVGASVGVVAITPESRGATAVLAEADVACYVAKERGRNRIHLHLPEDDATARRHTELRWVAQIADAVEQNRFELYFQPIVSLRDRSATHPRYEVLLRLRAADGRLIVPKTFIAAAERYKQMEEVDLWVIDAAFAWLARHGRELDDGGGPILSLNLSANSLVSDHLMKAVEFRRDLHGVDPLTVCFEITETAAVTNLNMAADLIGRMKRLGYSFALDDFGAGFSSFSYLRSLPVDFLKIDGAFVKGIRDDRACQAIIAAINDVGHTMGMRTIAESAEDEGVIAVLTELGVDMVQGFSIGRPAPLVDLAPRAAGGPT